VVLLEGLHYALKQGWKNLSMLEFATEVRNSPLVDRLIDVAKQRVIANIGQCGVSITVNNM
jgi:hypothetical protein